MKNKIIKPMLLFSIVCGWSSMLLGQAGWEIVGTSDIASNPTQYSSLSVDSNGVPYVAYQDWDDPAYGATVIKYDGTAWVPVGNAGFIGGVGVMDIAIDKNNIPYLAFKDGANSYKASVMKYNGTVWVNVGNAGFSEDAANYIAIDIDNTGGIYVMYEDEGFQGRLTVMKNSGGNWFYIGSPGFTVHGGNAGDTFLDMAVDSTGIPYVVYTRDGTEKAVVQRYNNGDWEFVGSSYGLSSGTGHYNSIAINSKGTPYVFYRDGVSGKANVKKYNGSSWVSVGNADFTASNAYYTSLAINGSDTPFVVFQDDANSGKATVMKYDGNNWVNVLDTGFSPIEASFTEIAIDESTGNPFVLYSTYSSGRELNVTVMNAANVSCKRYDQLTGLCTTGTIEPDPGPYPDEPFEGNYYQGDATDEGNRVADPGWTDPYPDVPCEGTHEQGSDTCTPG